MAEKVVIQLSAEGAESVAKAFRDLAEKGKAFADNLAQAGKAVAGLGDRLHSALKPQLTATEAAFRQLGLGGSKAFQDLARAAESDRIKAAFKTIQTSAFATGAEVDLAAKKMQASLKALDAPAAQAASTLNSLGGSAKRVFEIFTGVNLAMVFQQGVSAIKDFITESSKLGREQQLQEATFKNFAASVGVAGDVLAAQIDKAAGGIIDSGDAMKIAMRGLSAGLQPEQIVTLTDAARQLAKSLGVDTVEAYQSLTEAIATGRSRRLQEIAITVDMDDALEAYAVRIGKTVKELDQAGRAQALYFATMNAAGPVIESNRKINDEFGDSMKRLKIAWQDVQETIGVFINDTAVKVLTWLKQVKADVGEVGTIWVTTWTNAIATLTPLSAEGGSLWKLTNLVGNVAYALAALAEIMNLQILIFAKWTGSIQFASLVLQDLAAGRLPDFAAHTAAVTKRVEDATKAYEESGRVLLRLRLGLTGATEGANEFGQGWGAATGKLDAGRNALGGMDKQVKALVPTLKELAGVQLSVMLAQQASTTAATALEEALVQQRVTLHQAHDSELIAVQQRALDERAAALQKQYVLELNLAKQGGAAAEKAIADVEAKHIASFSQIAVARVGLSTKLQQIAIEEEQALASGGILVLKARLESSVALLAIQQKSTADIIAVQGSEEAVFRVRLGAETQAAIDAAEAQTKTQADYAAAVEAIMAAHYAKLGAFQQQAGARQEAAMLASMALAMKDVADLPEVAKLTTDLVALNRELMALKAPTDLDAESIRRFGVSFNLLDEETKKSLLSLRQWNTEAAVLGDIKSAENELRALKETLGQTGPAADVLRDFLAKTGLTVDQLDESTKNFLTTLGKVKTDLADTKGAQAFADSLAAIGLEAALVGRDFDLASANLGAFQKRILELQAIQNPTGAILEELDQLKVKFADTRSFLVWRDAFNDVFGSISSAINTSVQGVILGTQTMADAWDKLWKSIVLSFINSGIQRLLKGLQDSLWDFVAGLFGGSSSAGGGGGGWINALVGGIGKLLGGSSSSAVDIAATTAVDALNGVGFGATAAGKGLDFFGGELGQTLGILGGVVALGGSIFGLVNSIQSGSASGIALSGIGTAASAYNLAATLFPSLLPSFSTLLANALVAVAPQFAASVGTALTSAFGTTVFGTALSTALGTSVGTTVGTGAAAGGAGVGAGLGAGLSTTAWAIVGMLPVAIATAVAIYVGMAQDAEDAKEQFREARGALLSVSSAMGLVAIRFDDLSTALSAANLPRTLAELQSALDSLPDLARAVGVGAMDIASMIPEWRAKFGVVLLAALDAAHAQGIDGASFAANRNRRLVDPMAGGVPSGLPDLQIAVLRDADIFRRFFPQLLGKIERVVTIQQHFLESIDIDEFGVASGKAGGPRPDWLGEPSPGSQVFDPAKMNAQLDRESLTIAIRNAVVDVGAMLGLGTDRFASLTPGGSEDLWKARVGGLDQDDVMPSVAAIAQVQATLEAAGFKPGEYGAALTAYLISVDANVVNHPQWAKFTDALMNATTADAVAAAIAGLMPTLSPVEFYDAAKSITDSINAEMKAMLQHRADIVAAGTEQANVDKVDAILEGMASTVKAWAGLVQLYATLPVEMAAITGDLAAQTQAAIEAWQVTRKSMDDGVTEIQAAFDEALLGGNVIAIQQAGQALHDAAINRYNAELKMVHQIEAAIKATLDSAATLVEMITQVAQWDISSAGDFGTINALLDSLGGMAQTASTAAARLWAVDQALQAIIATLPAAIAKFGSMQHAIDWLTTGMQTTDQLQAGGPSQITNALIAGASQFISAMQAAIDAATGAAKYGLLQQQAAQFGALAQAAIAGVNQWATQAIAGAQEAAQAVLDGLAAQRDAQLAAIDAQIEGIQRAEQLAQESRRAEIEGLQEAIAKAREWASAVESMGKFIDGLKQGPLGPGNPADKLALAQSNFAAALKSYNAAPTAAGLTDLQGLAQTMLSLAEPIFSKPSPQFQALAATTIRQLEAANAMAAAMATDSEVLQAQLDMLVALDKTATQAAQDQIDALNDQKESITKDFEAQTKAIKDALDAQIKGINAARDAEIAAIGDALATALKDNAEAQAPLIEAALKAQDALLAAVTRGTGSGLIDGVAYLADRARETVDLLRLMQLDIASAVGTPLASGSDRVTEGLYHLHDDEAVLPKAMADEFRAAGGSGRSIRSARDGAGLDNSDDPFNSLYRPDFVFDNPAFQAAYINWIVRREQIVTTFGLELKNFQQRNHTSSHPRGYDDRLASALAAWRASPPTPPVIPSSPLPPPAPPVAPPTPPYVPPGPPWTRRSSSDSSAASDSRRSGSAASGGDLTIIVQLDGKAIGKAVLPAVEVSARRGTIHTIILETVPR